MSVSRAMPILLPFVTACGSSIALSLVDTRPEPAGDNCAAGGVMVRSGLDVDQDGVLADAEVVETTYVCSGVSGTAGADGAPGLDGAVGPMGPMGPEGAAGAPGTAGDDGNDGVDGSDGVSIVFAQESAGVLDCPAGGTRVRWGHDHNGNGVLDVVVDDPDTAEDESLASEEEGSFVSCDGASGVDGQDGAPGQDGVDGQDGAPGQDGADGQDGAGGQDGVDGQDGTDGLDSLVALEEVAAGGDCLYGGTRVLSGRDLDGDGTLDAEEVEQEALVCSGPLVGDRVIDGDLEVLNAFDLTLLDGVTEVTGTLSFPFDVPLTSGSMSTLYLPELRHVGALTISGTSSLRNVYLPSLRVVDGDLTLVGNMGLSRLTTFRALEHIGGDLDIRHNGLLMDLGGFAALSDVGGDVDIVGNMSLGTIGGFDALTAVGGDMTLMLARPAVITAFPALESVSGALFLDGTTNVDPAGSSPVSPPLFPALTDVVGAVTVGGGVSATGTFDGLHALENAGGVDVAGSALTGLDAFDSLAMVDGDVLVHHAALLGTLPAFPALTSVSGSLAIYSLDALVEVDGFDALDTVHGSLALDGIGTNDPASAIRGFGALTHVGGNLAITDGSFRTLDAFDSLHDVVGDLVVSASTELTTLAGAFPELVDAHGEIRIEDNARLHTVSGFTALSSLDGALVIARNPGVGGTLSGFPVLHDVGGIEVIGNGFVGVSGFSQLSAAYGHVIFNNASVTSFPTFPGLTHVTGDLWLEHAAMSQVDGFEALRSVGGVLLVEGYRGDGGTLGGFGALEDAGAIFIGYNDFVAIEGFESLTTVRGNVHVVDHPYLARVDAFGALAVVLGGLDVQTNPRFCLDRVDAAFPGDVNVVGARQAFGNGTDQCGLSVSGTVTMDHAATSRSCVLRVVEAVGGVCSVSGAAAAASPLPAESCPTSVGTVPFQVTELYRTGGVSWSADDVCFFLEVSDGSGPVLLGETAATPRGVTDADAVSGVTFPSPVAPAGITVSGMITLPVPDAGRTCAFQVYEPVGPGTCGSGTTLLASVPLGASCPTSSTAPMPYEASAVVRADAAPWVGEVCFALLVTPSGGPGQPVFTGNGPVTVAEGGTYNASFSQPPP